MSGYWILFTLSECPVCGNSSEYQERIFDRPKPDDYNDRHFYEQKYDGCMY